MRTLFIYILFIHTLVHAGLYDVVVEHQDANPNEKLFKASITQLILQLTAEHQPSWLTTLNHSQIIDLVESYYYEKTDSNGIRYYITFNELKVNKLLEKNGLTFIPENARPTIVLLPSENTSTSVLDELQQQANRLGLKTISALMDTPDLQAWSDLTQEFDSQSVDTLSRRYNTSQILAINDSTNSSISWLWYNQHVISKHSDSAKQVITLIAKKLRSQHMHQKDDNTIHLEIHGIKGLSDQQRMLKKICGFMRLESLKITNIKPNYILLSVAYTGGIDAFVTDWGEADGFVSSVAIDNKTDLAYEWTDRTNPS